MRVLQWMVERLEDRVGGDEHLFGVSPRYEQIDWSGLDFSRAQYDRVTRIDAAEWQAEVALHGQLFDQLAHGLPPALGDIRRRLAARLSG